MYSTEPLCVLVVDDDASSRIALAQTIRSLGHTCVMAEDGGEAFELYQKGCIDVIVSDWSMPRMTGLELCQAVRLHDLDDYTYFIFVTGNGEREDFFEGMRAGADDYLTKPVDLQQLEVRLAVAWRVVGHRRALKQSNARLRRDSERSFRAARRDSLTQLGNRLKFEEDLREIEAEGARRAEVVTLAIADIDWFKQYNDSYGHVRGDEALAAIGHIFRERMRASDRCYRFGGEEFVFLLRHQAEDDARAAMERIRQDVQSRHLVHKGSPLGLVTVSIGVASALAGPKLDAQAWLSGADAALYRAKAAGRNRVVAEADAPASACRAAAGA
jgi:diguanylate cyclase (GGDEF)-like protein